MRSPTFRSNTHSCMFRRASRDGLAAPRTRSGGRTADDHTQRHGPVAAGCISHPFGGPYSADVVTTFCDAADTLRLNDEVSMALDEATTAFLTQMAQSGMKPLHEMTPTEARGLGAALVELYGPGPEVARVVDESVPVEGGRIPVRILSPEDPRAMIVYYHGGGWVIGAIDEFDTLARRMVQRTGAAVALADYRLAPEHRYPTAAEDAWAALKWTKAHLDEHGMDLPLIVAGDSAGGNLAAIVARRATAEHGPEIALQVLVYPVTDADVDNASYLDPANQLMLSRDSMIWFWAHYAPDPTVRSNPDASPLQADDIAELPPAVVLTAEHDVLRDEGEAYAEKLRAAGVPVEHRRFAGQMHGFFTLLVLPGSADGLNYVGEQVDRHLAARPQTSPA
jgi:acetyl esterase